MDLRKRVLKFETCLNTRQRSKPQWENETLLYETPNTITKFTILCWKNFKLIKSRKRFLVSFFAWPFVITILILIMNYFFTKSLNMNVTMNRNPFDQSSKHINFLQKCNASNYHDHTCVYKVHFGILNSNKNEEIPEWIEDVINFIATKGNFDKNKDFTFLKNPHGLIEKYLSADIIGS